MLGNLRLDGLSLPQLTALARINDKAALSESLNDLASYAAAEIAFATGCDYCGVSHKRPGLGHGGLKTIGAWGLPESLGLIERPVDPDTLEGLALYSEEPVVVADLASESRFRPSNLLVRLGVTNGVTVPMIGTCGVHGILEAYRKRGDRLTSSDVAFLQASSRIIASFVDRREAEATLRSRSAEQGVLIEIGRVVASSLQIMAIYERFAELVRCLIPFDRISLSLVDEARGMSRTAYSSGLDLGLVDPSREHRMDDRLTGEVVSTRRSLLIREENAEYYAARLSQFRRYMEAGLVSTLSVPLVWRDEVAGVLTLRSLENDAYDETHAATATRISTLIAGAVANARLHDAISQLAHERLLLVEVGRTVNSAPDMRTALSQLARIVGELMPVDRMTVGIAEHNGSSMVRRFVSGLPLQGWEEGTRVFTAATPASSSVQSRRCSVLDPAETAVEDEGMRRVLDRYQQEGIRSVLYMPLVFRDTLQGLIAFSSRRAKAYGERELTLADRVAPHVSGFAAAIRAEEQLTRLKETHDLITHLAASASGLGTRREILEHAGKLAAPVMDLDLLVFAVAEQTGQPLTTVLTAGLSSHLIDEGEPFAQAVRDGEVEVLRDVTSRLASAGLNFSVVEPVRSNGATIGLLAAYGFSEGAFADEDRTTLQEVAACVGGLVERLRSPDGGRPPTTREPRSARAWNIAGRGALSAPIGRATRVVRTVIVDPHSACRGSVRAMLAGGSVRVVGECSAIREVPAAAEGGCDVAIWCLHAREGSEALVEAVQLRLSCKVLVLAERLSVDGLRNALRAGVSGYVSRDTNPGDLEQYVVTLALGGTVVEPALLSVFLGQLQAGDVGLTEADAANLLELSARDRQMLKSLAQGKSNREIALDFGLATGSVKNRLVLLYRRIGVSDRVEATTFALRAGLLK